MTLRKGVKLDSHARTERLRGRKGQEQRLRRLKRTNRLCERCLNNGLTKVATVVNHKVPLAHGGSDEDSNTENLCRPCDLIETARVFGFKKKQRISVDGWPVED